MYSARKRTTNMLSWMSKGKPYVFIVHIIISVASTFRLRKTSDNHWSCHQVLNDNNNVECLIAANDEASFKYFVNRKTSHEINKYTALQDPSDTSLLDTSLIVYYSVHYMRISSRHAMPLLIWMRIFIYVGAIIRYDFHHYQESVINL